MSTTYETPAWYALLHRSLAVGPASTYAFDEQLPLVILEAAFFGIYTLLTAFLIVSLLRSTASLSWKRNLLNAIGLSLYAPAAAHLAVALVRRYRYDGIPAALPPAGPMQCLVEDGRQPLNPAVEPCYAAVSTWRQSAPPDADRALSALLALNIILSDVVVLWRVCVLWPGSRCVRAVSVLLLVATAGMLCWGAYLNDDFEDAVSAGAIVSSWFTNVWTTALVAARAWKHREDIGIHLHTVHLASRVSAVLSLLVWSGMLYTLLWTLVMEDALAGLGLGAGPTPTMTRFRTAVRALKASVLVDLVGMYPAMVAAAVNLSGRFVGRTFCVDDVPSLLPDRALTEPVRLRSIRSATAQSPGVHTQTTRFVDPRGAAAVEDIVRGANEGFPAADL